MDASTPEGKIVAALKQELKARGLHYRNIASRLKVSEATVKRYFSGKGVTLAVLCRLAEIADLDLLSLASVAQQRDASEHKFTKTQQAALGKDKLASAVFFLLWHGWSPAQIGKEFAIGDGLDATLAKLQSWGLIKRLAYGVKILATPCIDEKGGGKLGELTRDNARRFLSEIDLDNQKTEWTFYSARLSRSSVAQLHQMITKFIEDTRALTIGDCALPSEEAQWYQIFLVAQPMSRKRVLGQG